MVKSKLIETNLRKKINVSEDNYGRFHLPQLNTFRILLSVTPVLHFQCFGYPYYIIIIYQNVGCWGTQNSGISKSHFLTRDEWDEPSPGEELGGLPL